VRHDQFRIGNIYCRRNTCYIECSGDRCGGDVRTVSHGKVHCANIDPAFPIHFGVPPLNHQSDLLNLQHLAVLAEFDCRYSPGCGVAVVEMSESDNFTDALTEDVDQPLVDLSITGAHFKGGYR